MKNLRSSMACMTFVLVSLSFPMAVRADNPRVCMELTPSDAATDPTVPTVTLDVFASNVPGSVSTVFGLNGTGLSTQASTNPPGQTVQLSYILTGTGIVTSKGTIEASLSGTASDGTESTFHVVIAGQNANDSYTQIIRVAGELTDTVVTGSAAFASTCDKANK
jgi:hypothetical protein